MHPRHNISRVSMGVKNGIPMGNFRYIIGFYWLYLRSHGTQRLCCVILLASTWQWRNVAPRATISAQLNVVPNLNLLGIKRFVPIISISFKCECFIVMQIQHTKNLNPERSELGTTLSWPNWSILWWALLNISVLRYACAAFEGCLHSMRCDADK